MWYSYIIVCDRVYCYTVPGDGVYCYTDVDCYIIVCDGYTVTPVKMGYTLTL